MSFPMRSFILLKQRTRLWDFIEIDQTGASGSKGRLSATIAFNLFRDTRGLLCWQRVTFESLLPLNFAPSSSDQLFELRDSFHFTGPDCEHVPTCPPLLDRFSKVCSSIEFF